MRNEQHVCRSAKAGPALRLGLIGGILCLLLGLAQAQDLRFFRIGTGSISGTYYPIGGLVADIISSPAGTPCDEPGSCGVPGLVAIAQTSAGSVANIEAMAKNELESGFAQSDIAYGAYTGTGVFQGKGKADGIRALANLYSESLHLVVRADAPIEKVSDLKGKRVSLDQEGSGSRVDAILVLRAFGIGVEDLDVQSAGPSEAVDLMQAGKVDAFFLVAGYPAAAIAELAQNREVRLLPLVGPEMTALVQQYPFFSYDTIPFGTYDNLPATETLAVGAQWLVRADLSDDLVYAITKALWRPEARQMLDVGHPKGRDIKLETALDGVAIPLHPGAARYYHEVGLKP